MSDDKPVKKIVDEMELRRIAIEWGMEQDPTQRTLPPEAYFIEGFRKCQEMNAKADLTDLWPGEYELHASMPTIQKHTAVYRIGYRDCYLWLREKLGVK